MPSSLPLFPASLPFADRARGAVPVVRVAPEAFPGWLKVAPARLRRWARATHFRAEAGAVLPVPGREGEIARVAFVQTDDAGPWDYARLPAKLSPGAYRLEGDTPPAAADALALGWALAAYGFDRYRSPKKKNTLDGAVLVWPKTADRAAVVRAAEATYLVRNLVNVPANDMGPGDLATAARALARRHGARMTEIVGDALLKKGYPAVHAVGRAAGPGRAPRLIDLNWGRAGAPRVTLVGKGVCFDTGGLDLKPSANMKLMKKDMGGAAHALGLAHMVMAAKLDVRLRVLIPAVENSVSGDAMRPLDVVRTRKGLTVEIGNTDAEGRVILADALAEAADERPALIADFATLTGAARAALGPELPALFCNDDGVADALLAAGKSVFDPLWRLPLWAPYGKMIEGKTADITNAPESGFAGAITAALFLERFVESSVPWVHLDIMAWNVAASPGHPEGGEAMGMRALFALLADRYGRGPRRKS
ncbi:MAG: leucyl aminopeptidase family protein [Acidimicrobiia bacterium]|nr:leucyl aminopeptidase family protein [Acidimicrobiia bacterium]